jgi:hypothetical protein
MYVLLHTGSYGSFSISEAINLGRFTTKECSPFLIPSSFVKHHLETRVQSLSAMKENIFQLELRMGVRHDHVGTANPLTMDLDDTTRQINKLNADLEWTMYSCKWVEQLLNFMDSVARRYATQAEVNNVSAGEVADVQRAMQDSHAFLRSWNRGIIDRADYLTKRLQALSQSVSFTFSLPVPKTEVVQVYSNIAQRDSANSISIAETGTRLAATSHQVAIATSRDSAVMRVITAVTVVFLPATFTAASIPRYTLTASN